MRTGLIPTSGGALSESWTYGYDVVSNITAITKPAGIENCGYDALDRLTAYTLPTQAQVTYGYDFDGNRLSETQSGVTVNHTYATTSNRQLTAAGAAIGYDANGNRSSDTGGSRTFSYDVRNRLRQAIASGQTVATYTINALGQRVRKVAGSSDVDFVYDMGGQLIGEYTNGTLVREYIYLYTVPVAQIGAGGAITYLHPDHLGTPRSATNSNAQIVWRWDSDPFGKATPNQDPDGDLTTVTVNLRFPGQYFDMETGLSYNYFRDYDSTIGRYVQSDPIGLDGGLNTYGYAAQNPASFIDPYGLACNANGCWVTPREAELAKSGNYSGYYATACRAGDTYACAASTVANDDGLLAHVTNWRLWNSLKRSGVSEDQCDAKMEEIRVDLAREHVKALEGGTPEHPAVLTQEQISNFHNETFAKHGAGPVFGGDIPAFGNWPFVWCSAPSCQP